MFKLLLCLVMTVVFSGQSNDHEDFYSRLIISIESTQLSKTETQFLKNKLIGGVLLFSRNIQDFHQLQQLTQSIGNINQHLLIFIDHEGYDPMNTKHPSVGIWRAYDKGTRKPLQAIRTAPTQYTIAELYRHDSRLGKQSAYRAGKTISEGLKPLGIIPLATVWDSNPYHHSPSDTSHDDGRIIWRYGRSFGADSTTIRTLVMEKLNGIDGVRVVKHFPDHGHAADTHVGVGVDHRSKEAINQTIEEVVKPVLNHGVDLVMTSHVRFLHSQDPENPVSLSPWWLGYLHHLKQDQTLIISDDLVMQAVTAASQSIVEAVSRCSYPSAYMKRHHLSFIPYPGDHEDITHLVIYSGRSDQVAYLLSHLNDKASETTQHAIMRLAS